MDEEEIKRYFKNKIIYKYTGAANELQEKLISASVSHNTLLVDDISYFVCNVNINDMINADDKLSVFYAPEGV
jgi:hypothetical protein